MLAHMVCERRVRGGRGTKTARTVCALRNPPQVQSGVVYMSDAKEFKTRSQIVIICFGEESPALELLH